MSGWDAESLDEATQALKKLYGHRPYHTGSNTCRGDSYFAASLVREYGRSIAELETITGIHPKDF